MTQTRSCYPSIKRHLNVRRFILLAIITACIGCQRPSPWGVDTVELGMTVQDVKNSTKLNVSVEDYSVRRAKLLRGAWGLSDTEGGIFVTTPKEDGAKVMKIQYTLQAATVQQFDNVVAKLSKRYGDPTARGARAVEDSDPSSADGAFSYGWGQVRVENETVIPDPSGRSVVMRGLRLGQVLTMVIADGPLVRRYFGYDEDNTFEDPDVRTGKARARKIPSYGYSLTERKSNVIYGWEEGPDPHFGPQRNEYTAEFTDQQAHDAWRGLLLAYPRLLGKTTAEVAILRSPYPSLTQIESAIGKSDRVDTDRSKLFNYPLGSRQTCHSWFASSNANRKDYEPPVLEACFSRDGEASLLSLGITITRTADDKETEVRELVGRTVHDWHREGDIRPN